jgi:orotate phosphoribosyltransferase
MALKFREVIATALPSEERVRARLAGLQAREWTEVAGRFGALLPEFDLIVALPCAENLAVLLARTRGVPQLTVTRQAHNGHWSMTAASEQLTGEAVIVTEQLTDGLAELETMLLCAAKGIRVIAVVAAVERTNAAGRIRLELHDVAVVSAVQLADTPVGLVFERRTPQSMAH